MRGFGAPHNESATAELVNPDWGWGDVPPSVITADYADYGWGSARTFAFSPYLLDVTQVGDDGGYLIEIRGTFPRNGASLRQRPSGFIVTLTKDNTDYQCYSGRVGQRNNCSTDLRALTLSAYTPCLDVGTYTVSFKYNTNSYEVGTIDVLRRTRTYSEYALRSALPSRYATGARRLELDTLLTNGAESARTEKHSNLRHLTRAVGESLGAFFQSGILTRLTADCAPTDTVLHIETTLGMSAEGAVFVGNTHFRYTSKTENTLIGLTRLNEQQITLTTGERVLHDTHTLTD